MRRTGIEGVGILGLIATLGLSAPALAQYREYYLRGRIVDTQKQPLADVEIQLRDVATSRSYHMKTGKDGAFKFAGLPHGVYEATFSRQGYPVTKVEWKFEAIQETMQRVEIPDVMLASEQEVQKVERIKAAESGTKDAAEKIRLRDFDGAVTLAEGLLAADPKNANALFVLGLAYVGKQAYSEAADALTQVTELQPAFAGAHFELGVCYRQLHDMPKALAAFEKGLELDPKNADAAYNAGLALFELTRIEEALARFEQGLAVKPQDPDLLEMAGRCYIHQAKLDKALESLERAQAASSDPGKVAFLAELIEKVKAQMK
jgi:tetratricopeptide (TPR) repeat protein